MLSLALLAAAPACADGQGDSISHTGPLRTDTLQEVTIYAATQHDIVPTQKLRGNRLEALSAQSVADAVRYFSGVQLKDYGGVGGLKTVDIRSMGSNHMGVFYDGVQLGNAQNGQLDLGRFSMDNIEEIALYNGQKSDLMQSAKDYGAGGTIYIKTRRPTFKEGKHWNLRATMRTGSFGLRNPSLTWEQRITPRLSASISAEHTGATGRYRFRYRRVLPSGTVAWDTTAVRHNGDILAGRAEAALFGQTRKQGEWTAKAYFYDSERGIPGAIVNNVWKHHQRQWDRNAFVQGGIRQRQSDRYEWKVDAKYAEDRMRYLNPDPTLMYIDNRFLQRELYLTTSHHLTFNRHWQANLSGDWQWNSLRADLKGFTYPHRNTLMWSASATYELDRLRILGSLTGTHIFDGARQSATAPQYHRASPQVVVSWQQNAALSLRAFVKRTFRMPTFNDLYYTDVGSISLKPETATQFNAGVLYSKYTRHRWFKKVELKGDAYANLVDNKIVAIPKGSGQYRWMMMNIGRVRILGSELSAEGVMRWHHGWRLSVQGQWTWQRARDLSDPADNERPAGTYRGQIAYIPRHSASATANLAWRQWGLNYAFIYVGQRWHNSSNIAVNHEEPWYTSDLALTWQANIRRVGARVSLECNNVFDQQYDVVLNYPMPGRNWRVTLQVRF